MSVPPATRSLNLLDCLIVTACCRSAISCRHGGLKPTICSRHSVWHWWQWARRLIRWPSNRTGPQQPQYLQYTHTTYVHSNTHSRIDVAEWSVLWRQCCTVVSCCVVSFRHFMMTGVAEKHGPPMEYVPPGYKWVALLTFPPLPLLLSLHPPLLFLHSVTSPSWAQFH